MNAPARTGNDEAPVRLLRAGGLSAELTDCNLRAVRWHGYEAIRAIQYLVRDENWGTLPLDLESVEVEEQADSFAVAIAASCRSGDAILSVRTTISGTADGTLVFEAQAVPDGDFRTNRCGFCILHPIVGVAGTPVIIEHCDGTSEASRLPELIEPAQPFFDMRAITHRVAPGVEARCLMEGDAFEMEDQRNWSDASYKTYVRPLALPWPYTLAARQPVRQKVTLSLRGVPAQPAVSGGTADPVRLDAGEAIGPMPVLALSVTPQDSAATLDNLPLLAQSGAGHLILHYNPAEGHGAEALEKFSLLVNRAKLPATLEFVLPCRDLPGDECASLAAQVRDAGLHLSALAISPAPDLKSTPPGSVWPDCPPLEAVYGAARAALPDLALGGGMFSYFTELNRKRVPANLLDFVTHTTAPIVHAADDRSVMETLEALAFITASVRAIFGEKPYRIGPSTIGMRHNPYGARLNENPDGRRMTMTADDPRQKTQFAAAWMVGYAAAVAPARLQMLCLGALTGRFGIVGDEGRLRPAFHAMSALGRFSGRRLRQIRSSDPSRVLALGDEAGAMLVANISAETVRVALPGPSSWAVLDEASEAAAAVPDFLDRRTGSGGEVGIGAYGIAAIRPGAFA